MSALLQMTQRRLLKQCLSLQKPLLLPRLINTSSKKQETAVIARPPVTEEDFAKPNPKNWVSYGFEYKDEKEDRIAMHMTAFSAITLCIVIGGFVWAYLPDTQMRDWAQREGFLELRRREQAGADLVSPNYIDPSKMVLPSDEDLGDTEIII